jgi:hypothetical protein
MAGQVDEMTATQYTKGHPIPCFALKDNVVTQTVQTETSGEGHQKKQSPHKEKLTNLLYSLRNGSADVGGNKVKNFLI